MLGIRADANGIIASGHVMRCVAIAEQIEKRGEAVMFITADHFPDELLNQKGFKHVCLESDWQNKNVELGALDTVIKDYDIATLLVDSYQVTKEYLEALHKRVRIAYIDDLYMFEYPVDIIINYAIDADSFAYKKYTDRQPQLLIGPEYTPLRKEFQNIKACVNPEVKNVIITTGGSDNYHIILKLVEKITKIKEWNNISFHIIVGRFFHYEDTATLEYQCSSNNNIKLHKNVKNMAEIMVSCDLAVSAGGTTLAEICACGLPCVCFAIADNQIDGVTSYGKLGIMACAGDIRQNIDNGIETIFTQIALLINNYNIRKQYSSKGSDLIDGSGAGRIAEFL